MVSVVILFAVKPVFPLSPFPISAFIFVLAFSYTMACLFALGELTARPLTPRTRIRQPKASVFAVGVLISLAAPAVVVATAPYVAQTLLGKILVCLHAALCAGAFAACFITSVRLCRTSFDRMRPQGLRNVSASAVRENETGEQSEDRLTRARPLSVAARVRNGFDRATARSLVGFGLVSCATGFGIALMLMPACLGVQMSFGIGGFLFAASVLFGAVMVRSALWMRLALAQWIGLLLGLTAGYFLTMHAASTSQPLVLFLGLPSTLFVLGTALLLSHASPAVHEPSHTVYPLPEPTASTEQFCAEAAKAFGFTPREAETLLLVLENLEAHEIADELGVTPKTAKSYIRKLCRKTQSADIDSMVETLDAWWREGTETP